jgi:hypothetical protein
METRLAASRELTEREYGEGKGEDAEECDESGRDILKRRDILKSFTRTIPTAIRGLQVVAKGVSSR